MQLPAESATLWVNDGVNNKPYKIVLRESGRYFDPEEIPEPPFEREISPIERTRISMTHLGMGHSQFIEEGFINYSRNVNHSKPFVMRPGPKINAVTLTSNTFPISSVFSALGWVFLVAVGIGRIYRFDPTAASPTGVLSKSDAGITFGGGARWKSNAIVCEGLDELWKLTTITPGGPDGWAQGTGGTFFPYFVGTQYLDRLFGIDSTCRLRNVLFDFDETVTTNWQDNIQVGDTSNAPQSIIGAFGSVYVGTLDGFFGVNNDGLAENILPEIANYRGAYNCKAMAVWKGHIYFGDHMGGLWRWRPGARPESVGLEWEKLDDSPLRFGTTYRWNALAGDSRYLYGVRSNGSETYIMRMRERQGEKGFGPLVIEPWIHFSAACEFLYLDFSYSKPRLYYGYGNNFAWSYTDDSEFATSGDMFAYLPDIIGSDRSAQKWYPKVALNMGQASAAKYAKFTYSLDGGSELDDDKDAVEMRATSNGRNVFQLPRNVAGQRLRPRVDFVSNSDSIPPELYDIEIFWVARTKYTRARRVGIICADELVHGESTDERRGVQVYNDLQTLSETSAPVTFTGAGLEAVAGVFFGGLQSREVKYESPHKGETIVEAIIVLEDE